MAPRGRAARWSECAWAADSGSPRNPWVSWGGEHRSTRIRAIRTRGAQKLAWGSPLAGNGAPEMGRMSAKDPEGVPAAPLGFAIVGCGVISPFHARAISDLPDARLVAVVDLHDERAAQRGAEFEVGRASCR